MQLLKLVHSYNATSQQGTRPNPRNYYLNILENCVHVPKDDRLVIRKYLCGIRNFDESNQILALLSKNSKKRKENMDKKFEVLLRKFADKIRKQERYQIITKVSQPQPKNSIPQSTINIHKYCTNFELLKSNLRMPSTKKSASKSHDNSLNGSSKKLNQILQSTSPKNINIRDYSSANESRQVRNKGKFESSNKPLFKLYQSNRASSQQSKNRQNIMTGDKLKSASKGKELVFYEQEGPKHRHTRSRSLGELIQNIQQLPNQNAEKLRDQGLMQAQDLLPVSHHYENEQFSSFGNNYSEQYASNTSAQNQEQSIMSQTPMNFTATPFSNFQQYNTESAHVQLKELKLCSEDFLDFLMPVSIKQSRSPSDFSFLYCEFINKLNKFIETSSSTELVCSPSTIYIPFHTQYDLVTFQKIVQFVQEYTVPKFAENYVRDIYTRIEAAVCGTSSSIFNHKRINVSEFKKCYEWNRNATFKFQQLAKRCNRWATCLTYWELYWLKDSEEFGEFQREFNC